MREGERADVLAAVHYLTQLHGVDPRKVYVAGYSFGAAVALAALDQSEHVRGFVGISYPWGVKSMLVPAQGPSRSPKPKLFLTASEDVMCRDGVDGGVRTATAEVMALPHPRELVVVEGDHSWSGNHRPINRHVLDWLSRHEDSSGGGGGGGRGTSTNEGSIRGGRKLGAFSGGGARGGVFDAPDDGAATPRRLGPPASQTYRPRGGPTTPRNGPGVYSNRDGRSSSPAPSWDQQLRKNSFARGAGTPRNQNGQDGRTTPRFQQQRWGGGGDEGSRVWS